MVAPNRRKEREDKTWATQKHQITSPCPSIDYLWPPCSLWEILLINFNRRRIWVGLRFPAPAHSNRCIPDHSEEEKIKVQIPSNCSDRRDGFLCCGVILNSVAVVWHDVFSPLCQINSLFLCGRHVTGRAQNKTINTNSPQKPFHISHLTSVTMANPCLQTTGEKTAWNVALAKRQGINSACSVSASQSVWATSGDELPQQNAKTSAMERRAKDCSGCPTLVPFTFLFHPFLH